LREDITSREEARSANAGLLDSSETPVRHAEGARIGIGSPLIDEAKNFKEGNPRLPLQQNSFGWSSFYTPHYEEWCSADGTTMSCKTSL
jgi:hypothetical protein